MTLARFILGFPLAALAFVPLLAGARAARRRLVPDAHGVEPVLIDGVLVLSALTVTSQALGSVGWFRLVPVVIVNGAVGLLAHRFIPSVGAPVPPDRAVGHSVDTWRNGAGRAATAALALVVGSWLGRVVAALRGGMTSIDTMWYHLPAALEFIASGRTGQVMIHDSDSITAFYPLTSSIFHGVLLLLFDSDLLSVFVTLGWFALVGAAAYQMGAARGRAHTAMTMAVLVLATPVMVETQPGSALTDAAGTGFLLCALALCFGRPFGDLTRGRALVGGLALGLSTGMKFSFLAPAGLVVVVLAVFSPRGARVRAFALVTAAALVTGGYWFVRNLVAVGNPLPTLELEVGPVSLPHVPSTLGLPLQHPIETFLSGAPARAHLVPGFRDALGPLWWVVLALGAAGMAVAVVRARRDAHVGALGAVAAASTVAFALTPQYLLGGMYWATTLRYALPGLTMALIAAAIVVPRRFTWFPWALLAVVIGTQLDPVVWTVGFGGESFFPTVARSSALLGGFAALVATAAALAAGAAWSRGHRPGGRAATVAALLAVATALVVVHQPYMDRRYASSGAFPRIYAWGRELRNSSVGVNGPLAVMKYPLAGLDRSNRVPYLAVREDDGVVRNPRDCGEWRRLLHDADLRYVVVNQVDPHPLDRWTESIPGAERLITSGDGLSAARLYELPPDVPTTC